jgi:hypothetical protein
MHHGRESAKQFSVISVEYLARELWRASHCNDLAPVPLLRGLRCAPPQRRADLCNMIGAKRISAMAERSVSDPQAEIAKLAGIHTSGDPS